MADTVDDLSAPLGQDTERRKRRFRLPFTAMQAVAGLLGLFLLIFIGFALFNDNPLGGEPIAQVAMRDKSPEEKAAAPAASPHDHGEKVAPKPAETGEHKTVTIIDGSSGKRKPGRVRASHDDGGRPTAARKDPLRHDPSGRRRPETIHGLRG
jgi:hypothetical protein